MRLIPVPGMRLRGMPLGLLLAGAFAAVHAQDLKISSHAGPRPDPTDASAPVPPALYRSALHDYQPLLPAAPGPAPAGQPAATHAAHEPAAHEHASHGQHDAPAASAAAAGTMPEAAHAHGGRHGAQP